MPWCEALFFRISKFRKWKGSFCYEKTLKIFTILKLFLKKNDFWRIFFFVSGWKVSKENWVLMSLIIIIIWFWKKINKFWAAKHVLSGQKCDFSEVDFQIFANIEIWYVFSYKSLLPWCSAPSYHHHRWSQKSKVKYFGSSDQKCWFFRWDSGLDLRSALKRRTWLWVCDLRVFKFSLGDRGGS